jgi:hypothetical protein
MMKPGEAPPQKCELSIRAWMFDMEFPTVVHAAITLALNPVYPVVGKEFVAKKSFTPSKNNVGSPFLR